MKIAVAGGTGAVGSLLVTRLKMAGHEPVVLARATGVDLMADPGSPQSGLEHALDGVEAVIDVTSTGTTAAAEATRFFTTTTEHLLDAGYAAGVRHHVLLSIVGIDVTPFGYYVGKVAQEATVEDGRVPFTIARATQFHEFAGQMIERASVGPLVVVVKNRVASAAAVVPTLVTSMTASTPSSACSRPLCGLAGSAIRSTPVARARTTGSWPAILSRVTRSDPTTPVPPATATLMARACHGCPISASFAKALRGRRLLVTMELVDLPLAGADGRAALGSRGE